MELTNDVGLCRRPSGFWGAGGGCCEALARARYARLAGTERSVIVRTVALVRYINTSLRYKDTLPK